MTENPDIIQIVAKSPNRPKVVVGFAAETENVLDHAIQKLSVKNLDWIVANDISDGQIFGRDETTITLLNDTEIKHKIMGTKKIVAYELMEMLVNGLED